MYKRYIAPAINNSSLRSQTLRQTTAGWVTCVMGLLLVNPPYALAERVGDVYAGVSYGQTIARDESSRNLGTFRPTTIGVGLSVIAASNLALDGYVFTGAEDASHDLPAGRRMTVAVANGYGFNLRPFFPLNDAWILYAKLGRQYGTQETVTTRLGVNLLTTRTTYAHTVYGLGVGYAIDERWGVGIDYLKSRQVPSEMVNTSLISVGVRYKL